MSPSLTYLEREAGKLGFQISPLEKVVRLGELAGDISRHPFLGRVLLLKGGTALNLGFGVPSRLSVDLDFNYVGQIDRARMLEERPQVEDAIQQLATRHNYQVQRSADAFAGQKFYLSYLSALGGRERIEIDLNFLFRIPIGKPERREIWQPGELDRPMVGMVSLSELILGKLLALLDRGAVRDAWDVGRLPAFAGDELRSNDFRARFIALSAILKHGLPNYTYERFEQQVTDRAIREALAPMLARDVAPPPDVLAKRAWDVVRPLLDLNENEIRYFEEIARGELRLDYIFPDDPAEINLLASHPAIQRKLTNVRKGLPIQKSHS